MASTTDTVNSLRQNTIGRQSDKGAASHQAEQIDPGKMAANETQAVQPAGIQGASQGSIPKSKTAAGLLDGILAKDSPLMQRAATQGKQFANSRGLLNSSMAAGAAQGEMIDRASPLAMQDSRTYADMEKFNVGQENTFRRDANSHNYNLNQMEADYGFRSDLSRQEAAQSLEKLYASSSANAWGVMANNITDLVGQASSQIERIQMNPDISDADKSSLIQQVLSNRDTDTQFQASLYQNLSRDLFNTGVFPDSVRPSENYPSFGDTDAGSDSGSNQEPAQPQSVREAYDMADKEANDSLISIQESLIQNGTKTMDQLLRELGLA